MSDDNEVDSAQVPPEPEDIRLLIERAWADVHHSRVQEWSALGVVTGAHVALFTFVNFFHTLSAGTSASLLKTSSWIILFGTVFSILGAVLTFRVRELITQQMTWVRECYSRLKLIKGPDCPNGIITGLGEMRGGKVLVKGYLRFPPLLSASGLIFLFYVAFTLTDLVVVVVIKAM